MRQFFGEKKQAETCFWIDWWRWRELNPRPQILRCRYYMFFLFFILVSGYPTGRENR